MVRAPRQEDNVALGGIGKPSTLRSIVRKAQYNQYRTRNNERLVLVLSLIAKRYTFVEDVSEDGDETFKWFSRDLAEYLTSQESLLPLIVTSLRFFFLSLFSSHGRASLTNN